MREGRETRRATLKWQCLKPYENVAEMIDQHWDGMTAYLKAMVGISLEEPTRAMRAEAAKAGFYERPFDEEKERYPRLQLLTIVDLLKGQVLYYALAGLTSRLQNAGGSPDAPGRLPFDGDELPPRV